MENAILRKVLGKAALRKVMRVRVCSAKATEASIGYEKRSKPMANGWQTDGNNSNKKKNKNKNKKKNKKKNKSKKKKKKKKKKDGCNHRNNSKTCKAKPVLTVER